MRESENEGEFGGAPMKNQKKEKGKERELELGVPYGELINNKRVEEASHTQSLSSLTHSQQRLVTANRASCWIQR